MRLKTATVTTCTQPVPYWSFSVSSATIRVENYARMWNVRIRASKVPFFYLPYLIWPVKEDRAIGLLMPEFHTTLDRGFAISQELFIPIGRSADLTLLGRYYTVAGPGGGGEFRFVPNNQGQGAISGFYIRDKVTETDRYRFSYKQTQQFKNGFRMFADINDVSDFNYYADFERSIALVSSPTILARLEFSRNGSWTSLNVRELRRKQLFLDQSSLLQQTLPEIEWRGRTHRLGRTPFYLAFDSSLASIQQREKNSPLSLDPTPAFKADYLRGFAAPTLSTPFAPLPWLDITPQITLNYTYYTQYQRLTTDSEGRSYRELVDSPLTRQLWAGGLEIIGPKLYRIFERPDSPYSTRFKHAIETRFIYGYAEPFDRLGEIIPYDEVDRVSGSGNQLNYALVQRLFAKRPQAEPPTTTDVNEAIVLPDGTKHHATDLPPGAEEGLAPSSQPKPDGPSETLEIATLELRQTRSFDQNLSFADLDGDGTREATSPFSDLVIVGRYNPSPTTTLDLRSNYHTLHNSFSGFTLSGGVRRKLTQVRFSYVHRNTLEGDLPNDNQARITTGFNLLRGKLRLDLDASIDFDPPADQSAMPDRRWRVQYATQCCTFVFEQLTREYLVGDDRDDFYFRVDFKGIGKILDLNY